MTSLRHTARTILDTGLMLAAMGEYYLRGKMRPGMRHSVLNLHCRTNGKATALLTPLVRAVRPPRPRAPTTGLLGNLSVQDQDRIANAIARDGFYVFENRVPDPICDEIEAHARRTPAAIEGSDALKLFDAQNPESKTYRLREEDIVKSPVMHKIMADPSILTMAETYLKTLPVLSGLNLWFSPSYGNAPGDNAAQEFHFDFDPPPIWLLFFIYLTDVGSDNGPHVFVRGSHKPGTTGMKDLLARGYVRIPDQDIVDRFGAENVIELQGKRGTVLAVDTRGMHKGKMPVIGHRLIAQLSFCTPPFSDSHGNGIALPQNIDPALTGAMETAPQVYVRYHR